MSDTEKTQAKSRYGGEQVLVTPDSTFSKNLPQGQDFFPMEIESLSQFKQNARFIDRETAEEDESFRQLIPYVMIRRKIDDEYQYFLFQRLNTQGEARLHNLYSLGAGGHINPVDEDSGDPLEAGLKRELEEELHLPDEYKLTFKGWIYSRIDPVACVHAGMVYFMDIISGNFSIRETDKMTGQWHDLAEMKEFEPSMEGWSKIVMKYLLT